MKKTNDKKIVGVFEKVGFPEFGMDNIAAKIDTGAYSGALHCSEIRLELVDGKYILQFSPFDNPKIVKSMDEFSIRIVKSSNGSSEQRCFVRTIIRIHNQDFPVTLSLTDRSDMKWPVLVGRRFLRKHNIMVDPNKNKN